MQTGLPLPPPPELRYVARVAGGVVVGGGGGAGSIGFGTFGIPNSGKKAVFAKWLKIRRHNSQIAMDHYEQATYQRKAKGKVIWPKTLRKEEEYF